MWEVQISEIKYVRDKTVIGKNVRGRKVPEATILHINFYAFVSILHSSFLFPGQLTKETTK